VTRIDATQFAIQADPQFQEQSNGTWQAHYPHLDWSVTALSKSEAGAKLNDEFIRRHSTGADVDAELQCQEDLLRRHFDKPIPGLYVMDNDLYIELRDKTDEERMRAFSESERRRALGQPYTKLDYLRKQGTCAGRMNH
jgi:hypothetical protein